MLTVGRAGNLHWSTNGEAIGSIGIRTEADRVTLNYRMQQGGAEWQDMNYPIHLAWTPCHLGGRRTWFQCPAAGCNRRVGVLYLGSAGIFACRHCYGLAYACQRESQSNRAIRRADKTRERLGWNPGILNGEGDKPERMHWSTYQRLCARHDTFATQSFAGMAKRLGLSL